jgi:2-polyprenyl-3-methyl-5-hydroxy-6-metoxy-1,4-benzoquinol methylase
MPFKISEYEQLTRGVTFSGEDVALDLGCGNGIKTLCLGKKCKYIIGLDPNEEEIKSARMLSAEVKSRISCEFICGKLEEQEFCNNYFDKVFSICVLEHIQNYEDIMKKVYEILRPGGEFIFSVDNLELITDQDLIEKHKIDYGVAKYFKAEELTEILKRTGFKNINVFPIFRSGFSERLFVKGIKSGFNYGKKSLLLYLSLRIRENFSKNEKGIFLIAKCNK